MVFKWSTFLFVIVSLQCFLIDGRIFSDDYVGQISGNRLENDQFRLSIEVPKNWTMMSLADIESSTGLTLDGNIVIPVFGIAKHPFDSTDNNPTITVRAEQRTSDRTSCAIQMSWRQYMLRRFPSMKYDGDCREIMMNRITFAMQNSTAVLSTKAMCKTQYSCWTKNDYLITFTLTFFEIEQKNILDGVMQSLSFSS